jgi:hypothetical protein
MICCNLYRAALASFPTAPLLIPASFAAARTLAPLASAVRAISVFLEDQTGRPNGLPVRVPVALARSSTAFTRATIMLRSNSAVCGAPHTSEFERAIIVERVNTGIARAKANGTKSGKAISRPALKTMKADAARAALAEGQSIRAAALAAGIPKSGAKNS